MNDLSDLITPLVPFYQQVREAVRSEIQAGRYLPGQMLPSENEYAQAFGVNRLTIRSAIDGLVEEGLIKRVRGKGAFVLGRMELNVTSMGGFETDPISNESPIVTRVVSCSQREAGAKFGRLFGISKDDAIWQVQLLRTAIGEPVSLEVVLVPTRTIPDLDQVDLGVFSMTSAFEFAGISLVRRQQKLTVSQLSRKDASLLKTDPTTPVLWLESSSFCSAGELVEFSQTATLPDRCRLAVDFSRARSN